MVDSGWRLDQVDGLVLARCDALSAIPGVAHAFSTRIARGEPDFDLGPAEGEDEAVRSRRERFARAAGLGDARPSILRQVHGRTIVGAEDLDGRPPEADGIVRARASRAPWVPAVRTADCVPILLVERSGRSVAALHAGWRGTAAGIAAAGLERLRAAGLGDEWIAALGPAILGCCYEVGEEVVAALSARVSPIDFVIGDETSRKARVDLHAANAAQLIAAGLAPEAVHRAPWCTRCRNDLFFSVRAEGSAAGRQMGVVGPAARP